MSATDSLRYVTASKLKTEFQGTKGRVLTVKSAPYDILKKDVLGNPIWVEAAEDLRKASARIKELALHSPGEYFVFNQQTSEFITALTGSSR